VAGVVPDSVTDVPAPADVLTRYSRDGLTFDVVDSGPRDGEVVVLLHGFPEDSSSWQAVTPVLDAAGYRTLAPDQRGYSPAARPTGAQHYRWRLLVDDVLALLDSAGAQQAHVVGHDWGGFVAWALAADAPQRVRTLTVLSTPHPAAMTKAMLGSQALRSWYIGLFQVPWLAERVLAPGSRGWRLLLTGLPREQVERYSARMREPGALTAALDWYRALPREVAFPSVRVGRITVPTLYKWGNRDPGLGRAAAQATADMVSGPYRFDELLGAGHWLPELNADEVASRLLEHLQAPA
jgi:pimeloyl-ACP methyl ester carboxylesterase